MNTIGSATESEVVCAGVPVKKGVQELSPESRSVIRGTVSSTGRQPVEDFPYELPWLYGSMRDSNNKSSNGKPVDLEATRSGAIRVARFIPRQN